MESKFIVSDNADNYAAAVEEVLLQETNRRSNKHFDTFEELTLAESLSSFGGSKLTIGKEYRVKRGLIEGTITGTKKTYTAIPLEGGEQISFGAFIDSRPVVDECEVDYINKEGKEKTRKMEKKFLLNNGKETAIPYGELIDALAHNPEDITFVYLGQGYFTWKAKVAGEDFNGESFPKGARRCAPRHVKAINLHNPKKSAA